MNKKLKIGLFSFAALATAGVAGGVTAGVLLNQQNSSIKTNNNFVSNTQNNVQSSEYALRTVFNKETQSFKITVKNAKSENGLLKLISPEALTDLQKDGSNLQDKLVDSITANAGDKVYVVVLTKKGVEARNIKVTGADQNISLGTEKIDTPNLQYNEFNSSIFSFELPTNVTIVNGEESSSSNEMNEGFPIDAEGNLTVSATYIKSEVASWTWNYNYRSYVLNLDKDITLDNSNADLNINKAVQNGDVETSKLDTIPFIIFLNGHNVNVGTFTIPSGVTLYLIKDANTSNSKDNQDVTIKLANSSGKNTNYGFILEGVIANYQGIKIEAPIYSKADWEQIYQHYINGDYNFDKSKNQNNK